MTEHFLGVGISMLLSAMLPGADFALVTRNTLLYSRRAGLFTSFGITIGALVHITYCSLGLALLIANSPLLFSLIRYVGAAYLIYLGMSSFLARIPDRMFQKSVSTQPQIQTLSAFKAISQGFLCNLLNPKATLFFLALFTVVLKAETSPFWLVLYGLEMLLIICGWFCSLTLILSHPRVMRLLEKSEKWIAKLLGIFLISFGLILALVR